MRITYKTINRNNQHIIVNRYSDLMIGKMAGKIIIPVNQIIRNTAYFQPEQPPVSDLFLIKVQQKAFGYSG